MSDLLSNPSNEGLVVNSTQIESDTDLVYQAKKVKTTTSDKLKQLRRKFEAQNVASQVEIKSIKKLNLEMDQNVTELDNEIRNLSDENSRIQDALANLEEEETKAEEKYSEANAKLSENDALLTELTDCKTTIIAISKRVRSAAAQLSELNAKREVLIHDNSSLKQERFNDEIRLTSRERQLLEAKKEIDELERLLTKFNSLSCTSLSSTSLSNTSL